MLWQNIPIMQFLRFGRQETKPNFRFYSDCDRKLSPSRFLLLASNCGVAGKHKSHPGRGPWRVQVM
jgi:hypothetical protein